jgi:hypothetical protein
VLVAFSSGVVVALWLEWQPQAASDGGGMMAITSEPPGSTVYVDGARAGVTPAKLMLKPGDYLIAVGDGDERRSRTITMRSGDGFVHFEGTRAPAERLGELRIETEPAGLQVRLDGQARGTAPLVIQVPAGSHFVTVSAPGTAVNREVVVKAGARTSVLIAAGTGFTPR